MASFFSSSFDAATTATPTDVALADTVEAPTKDGFKEEVADEIAGTDRIFDEQPTEEAEQMAPLLLIKIFQQISITVIDK